MRLRSGVTLFLALVLGGVAVLLARAWLERSEPAVAVAPQEPQLALTKVVVARTTLFFGNRINAEHLREIVWPADSVPPGAFTSVQELLDAEKPRTVLRTIEANEPVLASKISGAGEKATLSAVISEEMRAMTIRVNDVIIKTMPGNSVIAVISIRICNVSEYSCPPLGAVVTVTAGMPAAEAKDGSANAESTPSSKAIAFSGLERCGWSAVRRARPESEASGLT